MAALEERTWRTDETDPRKTPSLRGNGNRPKGTVSWQEVLGGGRDLTWRDIILDTKAKKRVYPVAPNLSDYGYQIQETIFFYEGMWLCKGRRQVDKAQVLIKILAGYPLEELKMRIRDEYQMMQGLQNSGYVLTPLAMVAAGDVVCLVMEWVDGMVFGTALFRKACSDLHAHLNLAIAFCSLLLHLHSVRIVQNDLCPFVFFYMPSNKLFPIRLCDLSRAFRFSNRERPRSEPPLLRLPYMAPEQTGRLNTVPDLRVDLYSLGVMLFQHLTGLVPVEAEGVLDMVHAVLTARPPRTNELELHVPFHYATLISRLLEKMPDERYVSAWGLREDLRTCLSSYKESGKVGFFPLGSSDRYMYYLPLTRLVGRVREADQLDEALNAAAEGSTRVVFLSGAPGTGKSSLLNELRHKEMPLVLCGLGLAKDLVSLFDMLLRSAQSLPEEQRMAVRRALRLRVAAHARLLSNALPAYAPLVQPSSTDGPAVPLSAEHLHDALADLAAALSRPPRPRPLLLLLDDAEGAEALTCRTILQVARACTGVLIVLAYNDEDMAAEHPLRQLIAQLREARVECSSITLNALSDADAAEVVRLCLDSPDEAAAMGVAVARRTQSNPFFFSLVLRALYDDATIDFDRQKGRWRADVAAIARAPLPPTAAEFLASRISLLPTPLIQILLAAACLSPEPASVSMLTTVLNAADVDVRTQLRQLCEVGFMQERDGGRSYVFRHSFVLRAMLLLFPAEKREQMHWKTGQALLAQGASYQLPALLQLNRGSRNISRAERKPLLALNLSVAQRARANLDLPLARSLLLAARSVVDAEGGWEQADAGARDVAVALYEVELLARRDASAAVLKADLERHSRSTADRTGISVVRLVALRELATPPQLRETAQDALTQLVEPLPWVRTPIALPDLILLFNNRISSLSQRPHLAPTLTLPARCLAAIASSLAVQQQPELAHLCGRRLSELTLTQGISPYTSLAFALTASELAHIGRFEDARQWAAAAIAHSSDESECGWVRATAQALYASEQAWLHMPLRSALKAQATAFDASLAAGSRLLPCIVAAQSSLYNFLSAQSLPRLLADSAAARALCSTRAPELSSLFERLCACFAVLCSPHADPLAHELAPLQDDAPLFAYPALAAAVVATEIVVLLLAEHSAEAAASAERHAKLLASLPCHPLRPAYIAAHALALCDLYSNTTDEAKRADMKRTVQQRLLELEQWNAATTINVYPLLLLVQAEFSASLMHDATESMRLFDELTTTASRLEPAVFAPLALELAGRFYWRHGARSAAHSFLGRAHDLVMRSGATSKAAQLTRRYPFLRGVGSARIANDSGTVDIQTAVQVSHALSAEIGSIDRLLSRLMRLLLDGGNAERAFFLATPVPADPPRVWASYSLGEASPSLVQRPLSEAALSETVVAFCLRTKQQLVVDHAFTDTRFAYDGHIAQARVKSILCVPALKGETLFGLLYLENNAYAGAFTEERVQLMHVVASQLAISLENAAMVTKITQVSEELRRKNDELKRVDETKDRFLSMISHELRTPLNGIIGTTSLMLDSQETRSEEDESYLTTIQSCSHSLLALVNDLLDLSRLQAGKMAIHTKPFALAECLDSAIYVVAPTAALKKLDMSYTVHPSVPSEVITDPVRLQQIILNLLSNGVKFTDRGHVLVSFLSAEPLPDGRRDLRFSVADTGIGISPENMRLLFNMFSQVDDSNERRFGGSGIGLFLCDRLLSLLGGRIWAESDGKSGTTFHVSLPVDVPSAPLSAHQIWPSLVGRRISVCVAFRPELETMQRLLVSAGSEVRICGTASALEATLDYADGAIVDLAVPGAAAVVICRNKIPWLPFANPLEWTNQESRPNIAPLLKPLQHAKFLPHLVNFVLGTLRPPSTLRMRRALRGIPEPTALTLQVPVTSDMPRRQSYPERSSSGSELKKKDVERRASEEKYKHASKVSEKLPTSLSAASPRQDKERSPGKKKEKKERSPRREEKDEKREHEENNNHEQKDKKEQAAGQETVRVSPSTRKEKERERDKEKEAKEKETREKEKEREVKEKEKDKEKEREEDDRRARRDRKKEKKEKDKEREGKKIATSASGPAALVSQRRTPLVLIVEDNAVNNKLLCQILHKSGHYQVRAAFDGSQALAAIERDSEFDAILMDVQMPVMDGLKATAELRKRGFDLPIIAVSASLDAATTAECAAAGMDDFISKPITRQAVLNVLLKWINRRHEVTPPPLS